MDDIFFLDFKSSDDFEGYFVFNGISPPVPKVGEVVTFQTEEMKFIDYEVVKRQYCFIDKGNRNEVGIKIFIEPVKDK